MTTWRKCLELAMTEADDTGPLVAVAPDVTVLDVEFDGGFGSFNSPDMLAWTDARVYFSVTYDGSKSVGSAPRNPTTEGQAPVDGDK